MPDATEGRRRWLGLVYLALAAAMLIWGETILRPYLTHWLFVLYWLACFALTGLAIIIALLDMRATRRRIEEERHELMESTWDGIKNKPEDWDQTQ